MHKKSCFKKILFNCCLASKHGVSLGNKTNKDMLHIDYKHTAIQFIFDRFKDEIETEARKRAHILQIANDQAVADGKSAPKDFFSDRELTHIAQGFTYPLAVALFGYINTTDIVRELQMHFDRGQMALKCVVIRDNQQHYLYTHVVSVEGYIKEAHFRYRVETPLLSKVATPYKNYWERKDIYQSEITRYSKNVEKCAAILALVDDVDNWNPTAILENEMCVDNFSYNLWKDSTTSQKRAVELMDFYINLPQNKRKFKSIRTVYVKKLAEAEKNLTKSHTKMSDLLQKIHG